MSSKLKPLDLTSAAVGSTGVIDFNQFSKFNPLHMQDKAHIWLYNESGCGTDVIFQQSGNSHYLPAGAWGTFDLEPNDSQITVTVTYLLPNAPVSLLNAIYYAPGEPVPQAFTLGNSPIGITGGVSTSSVQTLSQEGAASNLLTIDIGDAAFLQLFTLYNDGHTVWAVDQSGVKHQVIKVQLAGNPLQLGQAGDISEVLGALTVDQTTILTGILTAAAANVFGTAGNLQHILGQLTVDQTVLLGDGKLGHVSSADIIDASSASDTFYKAGSNIGHLQEPSGTDVVTWSSQAGIDGITLKLGHLRLLAGTVSRMQSGHVAAVTGTVTHGLGATPAAVEITGDIAQPGSVTAGVGSVGSTTFAAHVDVAAAGFYWFCLGG